jgi:subtilisin family serine protease
LLAVVAVGLLVVTTIMATAQSANNGEELSQPPPQLIVEEAPGVNSAVGEQGLPPDSDNSTEPATTETFWGRIADYSETDNKSRIIRVELPDLSRAARDTKEVLVAVLDTGIDKKHEDLLDQVVAEANFTDSYHTTDSNGHGTHIAGIIAAKDNAVGITGVAPGCLLLNAKVADGSGRCEAVTLTNGIIWAIDNGASVINISVELEEPCEGLEEAVNYAWEKGSVIVAASGNDGDESLIYPASYNNCIAVCCLNGDGELFSLSNQGDWVDVAAPGFNIYSCLPDNRYGYKTGTSCAAAYVSGIAALLLSVVKDTNSNNRLNDEVRKLIETGYR